MDYCIVIKVQCQQNLTNFLILKLFEIGFDSFQEFEDGFEGSCEPQTYSERCVQEVLSPYREVTFFIKKQEKVNWNEEWEKNYDPIIVENRCLVRASFHKSQSEFLYEIIVTPKMSFGTGHHATTYQILAYQMELDHQNKKVLDVGTGTGILSIMAHKRGAAKIVATDIDKWCIENSVENFEINNVENFELYCLEINQLHETDFDIIIANINKNILHLQMKDYAKRLKEGGELILSGFYSNDLPNLTAEASNHFLQKKTESTKDNWAMLVLLKQSF
ncbi:MAG: 50S ribosomal protein L11 methyltransferase [Bacteroidota bacterium]